MVYTLPEIKRELKKLDVSKVTVHIEEYGEGFDTHVSVSYLDRYNNFENEYFEAGEEEPLAKAERRLKRIEKSLKENGYKVINEGLANC